MKSYLLGLKNPSHPNNPLNTDMATDPICPTTGRFQKEFYDLDKARRKRNLRAKQFFAQALGPVKIRSMVRLRHYQNVVSLRLHWQNSTRLPDELVADSRRAFHQEYAQRGNKADPDQKIKTIQVCNKFGLFIN